MNAPNSPDWQVLLEEHKKELDEAIEKDLPNLGPPGALLDACSHALIKSGSNRFRPTFVMMLSRALNPESDAILAALGVEYIIVAAKTVDDFPSMDDTAERGGRPSLHKQFGDGLALLASYALIAAGFRSMARQAALLAASSLPFAHESGLRLCHTVESLGWNIGAGGAAAGQLLDLTCSKGISAEEIVRIIDSKTASLYEMSCVAGWMFGGGSIDRLEEARILGRQLGRVMQMQDDLADQQQDAALNRNANLANAFGFPVARDRLRREIAGFLASVNNLGLSGSNLPKLVDPVLHYLEQCQRAAAVNC